MASERERIRSIAQISIYKDKEFKDYPSSMTNKFLVFTQKTQNYEEEVKRLRAAYERSQVQSHLFDFYKSPFEKRKLEGMKAKEKVKKVDEDHKEKGQKEENVLNVLEKEQIEENWASKREEGGPSLNEAENERELPLVSPKRSDSSQPRKLSAKKDKGEKEKSGFSIKRRPSFNKKLEELLTPPCSVLNSPGLRKHERKGRRGILPQLSPGRASEGTNFSMQSLIQLSKSFDGFKTPPGLIGFQNKAKAEVICKELNESQSIITQHQEYMESFSKVKRLKLFEREFPNHSNYSVIARSPYVHNDYHMKHTNAGYSRKKEDGSPYWN